MAKLIFYSTKFSGPPNTTFDSSSFVFSHSGIVLDADHLLVAEHTESGWFIPETGCYYEGIEVIS